MDGTAAVAAAPRDVGPITSGTPFLISGQFAMAGPGRGRSSAERWGASRSGNAVGKNQNVAPRPAARMPAEQTAPSTNAPAALTLMSRRDLSRAPPAALTFQ
jgi:hypothetical protein